MSSCTGRLRVTTVSQSRAATEQTLLQCYPRANATPGGGSFPCPDLQWFACKVLDSSQSVPPPTAPPGLFSCVLPYTADHLHRAQASAQCRRAVGPRVCLLSSEGLPHLGSQGGVSPSPGPGGTQEARHSWRSASRGRGGDLRQDRPAHSGPGG